MTFTRHLGVRALAEELHSFDSTRVGRRATVNLIEANHGLAASKFLPLHDARRRVTRRRCVYRWQCAASRWQGRWARRCSSAAAAVVIPTP
jgi:hypothetical protein